MVDYNDPLIRAVYGFSMALPHLHLLELCGVRRYLSMTDEQCKALLLEEPGTVCIPIALVVEKAARSRTKLVKEGEEEEPEGK